MLVLIPGVIVVPIVTQQIVAGRQQGAFQKEEGKKWRLEWCHAPRGQLMAHL